LFEDEDEKMVSKSTLWNVWGLAFLVLLVVGAYAGYASAVLWIVSPLGWNIGMVVSVLVILALSASADYLTRG